MNQITINKFDGEYSFLSNFYLVPIKVGDLIFPSVENAYQASKCRYNKDRKDFVNLTPGQAKRKGRDIELRAKWEDEKYYIMRDLLKIKFENKELKKLLLNTGNAKLIEGNTWGDVYWGVCKGIGRNRLGEELMYRRSDIQWDIDNTRKKYNKGVV